MILFGVVVVTGLVFWGLTRSPAGSLEGVKSEGGGMPPEVAKEFGERMKGARPPQKGPGR